ncbi:MAG: hypothetical protein WD155_01150, partial [Burkholderiales bacterium]
MFAHVARSRLLPMQLPFRYFGAAVAFNVAAWALLLAHARELNEFAAGLGPVFAALHLATLGVLAMAAIGATLQLLPVATRQPVRALWAVKLAWWLLVAGAALFAFAAATYRVQWLGPGAMLAIAALGIYGVLLFANLRGARGMRVVVMHGWAALACLAALAATGPALAARYEHGLALDHLALRNAHLVLAAYGFMGLLALGLSNFLLPMLAVAPPPPARHSYAVLALAVAGIALAVAGWMKAGALAGLAAAIGHVWLMERSLRARLRAPLGTAFVLVRAAWACLLASLALAALMALDLAPARAPVLFGLLLVPGWLLTFLLGVLQRIVPFLASVHALSGGRPLASSLTPHRLLAAHALLHLGALVLLVAGFAVPGAAAGLGAALAYAAFFVYVLVKARHHGIRPRHQPA